MNKFQFIVGAALVAGMSTVTAPAFAVDEVDPYVIVAWTVTDPANIWEPPQVIFTSTTLAEPDLSALDDQLLCGATYQVDQYNAGLVTDALIAGGILYGPNDPQEDLIAGGDGVAYKVVTMAPCEPEPTPEPTVPPVEPPAPELAATGVDIGTSIYLGVFGLILLAIGVGLPKLMSKTEEVDDDSDD